MDEQLEQKYRCYMKDCGCSPEQAEAYLRFAEKGQTQDQIYLLRRHRNQVMQELHAVTRQVDCIDFILYELEHEI